MTKLGWLPRAAALLFVAACLVSCTATAKPGGATVSALPKPSPSASLAPSPLLSAALSSTSAPEASPADSPMPTGLQHPLPTPGPTLTARPADAPLDANDYYVVTQNGREGVVDRNGQIVLKPEFAKIDIASILGKLNDGGYYEYFGKPLFFAVPGPIDAGRQYSAYLYGANGRMITTVRLINALAVGPDLIAINKATRSEDVDDSSEGKPDNSTGAILFSGKLVVPYQYHLIFQFGKTAAALKVDPAKGSRLDFYGLKGKMIGSMPVAYSYEQGADYYDEKYYECNIKSCADVLILQNLNGKYGILNDQLQWVAKPEWDSILYDAATGQFVMIKGKTAGVMDSKGNFVIPLTYSSIGSLSEYSDTILDYFAGNYYTLTNADGIYLLDAKGSVLFHSKKYNRLLYSNGVIIAQQAYLSEERLAAQSSDMYDLSGHFLLSIPDNIDEYYPAQRYFTNQREDTIYDLNGKALPLPQCDWVQCLSTDRFIITLRSADSSSSNGCGLCDAQGRWIIQPKYGNLSPIGSDALIYGVKYDDVVDGKEYGLADLNGSILTEPVFDEFDIYNQNLYKVDTGAIFGLMDSDLHWVWKTTVYDGLSD